MSPLTVLPLPLPLPGLVLSRHALQRHVPALSRYATVTHSLPACCPATRRRMSCRPLTASAATPSSWSATTRPCSPSSCPPSQRQVVGRGSRAVPLFCKLVVWQESARHALLEASSQGPWHCHPVPCASPNPAPFCTLAVATSNDSSDTRFLCLKLLCDIVLQSVTEPSLYYPLPDTEEQGGAEAAGQLRPAVCWDGSSVSVERPGQGGPCEAARAISTSTPHGPAPPARRPGHCQ